MLSVHFHQARCSTLRQTALCKTNSESTPSSIRGGKPSLVPLYPRRKQRKQLTTTWTMTLRRRIRNLHRCSLQVTRRSPTQTKSFHLPLLSCDLFDTSLNHENGPTRHWRNRTIPNRNNNALLRSLLARILLSNSFIQPPNKRVPNVRN